MTNLQFHTEIENAYLVEPTLSLEAATVVKNLVHLIKLLQDKIRIKDNGILDAIAGMYMPDEMHDEKENIRVVLEAALEPDNMEYYQRAETLTALYIKIEDLLSKPVTKQAITQFTKDVESLKQDDDPLEELQDRFRTTIGAAQFHNGFRAGKEMERSRIFELIETLDINLSAQEVMQQLKENISL